jgi:hypothetical protein
LVTSGKEGYNLVSNEEMLKRIEKKRAELIQVVLKNGLNSNVAIKLSKELDNLLNQYQHLLYHKN